MIRWLRRHREIERQAKADAEAFVRDCGDDAFWEVHYRESAGTQVDVATHQIRTPAHWRSGKAFRPFDPIDAATGQTSCRRSPARSLAGNWGAPRRRVSSVEVGSTQRVVD
jgi:hypothetical protein